MRISSGYENKKPRVEMLPLIDIVFLLLVFFIYAMLSMSVHRGLKVELPQAATASRDQREHVNIVITRNNELLVNDDPVTLETLAEKVGELKTNNPAVFIRGDRRADLGLAVEVLDRLRGAGVHDVSFETVEAVK